MVKESLLRESLPPLVTTQPWAELVLCRCMAVRADLSEPNGSLYRGDIVWAGSSCLVSPLGLCARSPSSALRSIPESMCRSVGRWLRPPMNEASSVTLSSALVPDSSGPGTPPDAPSGVRSARRLRRPCEHQAPGVPPGSRRLRAILRFEVSPGRSAGCEFTFHFWNLEQSSNEKAGIHPVYHEPF